MCQWKNIYCKLENDNLLIVIEGYVPIKNLQNS